MTIQNNWYQDFFTGLNVEMWERAATPEWTEQEATFLTDVLNCLPASHLLDVLCGFGRHAIALADRYIRGEGGQVAMSNEIVLDVSKRKKAVFLQAIGH